MMLDDFMMRALLAALGLALMAGPLGCFVIWRRMAYFGDATAHAAMLGVVIALAFSLPIFAPVLAVCVLFALLSYLVARGGQTLDSVLGVFSHSALAIALVAVSLLPWVRGDLSAYLFGDLLAVSRMDVWTIWAAALLLSGMMIWRWRYWLMATLDSDLAQASGVSAPREQALLMLMLALLVALALKMVGALLISAMILLPASAARLLARSPEAMALWAVLLSVLSVLGGLASARWFDTPASPSIIVAALVIYVLLLMWRRLGQARAS